MYSCCNSAPTPLFGPISNRQSDASVAAHQAAAHIAAMFCNKRGGSYGAASFIRSFAKALGLERDEQKCGRFCGAIQFTQIAQAYLRYPALTY
jgi:hypothetical protein